MSSRRHLVDDHPRDRSDDFAFARVIHRENYQYELRAIWKFDVRSIVPRGAGPARFRPEL